jgi:hypothetical protein
VEGSGSPSRKLIGEWLMEIGENEDLRRQFHEDPNKTLDESGLDEQQQRIVREGTIPEIQAAIRDEYGTASVMLFPMWHFFTAEEGSEEDGEELE